MDELTAEQKGNLLRLRKKFNTGKRELFKAFTDETLLSKWWAPEGFLTVTHSMNFKTGGSWEYSMEDEEDTDGIMYCAMEFTAVNAPDSFSYKDYYTDDTFEFDADDYVNQTTVAFEEIDDVTEVVMTIEFKDEESLEEEIAAGVIEGTEMCYRNLERLIEK